MLVFSVSSVSESDWRELLTCSPDSVSGAPSPLTSSTNGVGCRARRCRLRSLTASELSDDGFLISSRGRLQRVGPGSDGRAELRRPFVRRRSPTCSRRSHRIPRRRTRTMRRGRRSAIVVRRLTRADPISATSGARVRERDRMNARWTGTASQQTASRSRPPSEARSSVSGERDRSSSCRRAQPEGEPRLVRPCQLDVTRTTSCAESLRAAAAAPTTLPSVVRAVRSMSTCDAWPPQDLAMSSASETPRFRRAQPDIRTTSSSRCLLLRSAEPCSADLVELLCLGGPSSRAR